MENKTLSVFIMPNPKPNQTKPKRTEPNLNTFHIDCANRYLHLFTYVILNEVGLQ